MGNRRISGNIKDCALRLWEAGWAEEDICYVFRVSPSSLYRWHKIFEEFGTPCKPPSILKGRPCAIALAFYLAIHHDTPISISGLQATLEHAGLTCKVLPKIAAKRDEARCDEHRNLICDPQLFSGTGLEFITIDESSKDDCTLSRLYGRSPSGTPATSSEVFVRADRYTLMAAMSRRGYIVTRIVKGSMDASQFFDFIVEDVVQ
ncbi:hypothetical protein GGX14DRAFT_558538 [Mycena pura]|uniref:Transposase n=1 Tax=Mycena pura TaxID=153505 RepID=A0AAD7E081_9AGAR|nr:hypothetical protein GGX14DRAFT_558538 [Mycena pura]